MCTVQSKGMDVSGKMKLTTLIIILQKMEVVSIEDVLCTSGCGRIMQ